MVNCARQMIKSEMLRFKIIMDCNSRFRKINIKSINPVRRPYSESKSDLVAIIDNDGNTHVGQTTFNSECGFKPVCGSLNEG